MGILIPVRRHLYIDMSPSWPSQYKDIILGVYEFHYKDKTVSWPSYFYHRNLHTWRQGPECVRQARSVPWLPMPWLLASPGHQQHSIIVDNIMLFLIIDGNKFLKLRWNKLVCHSILQLTLYVPICLEEHRNKFEFSQYWDETGPWNIFVEYRIQVSISIWLLMAWWHKEPGHQQP